MTGDVASGCAVSAWGRYIRRSLRPIRAASVALCHIGGMTVYRITPDPDGSETFQVEAESSSGHLKVVAGFRTEEAAQEWITNQQIQAVKPAVPGPSP
jgi:hypothetical protein